MTNFTTSTGRQPRGLVKINGNVLTSGVIEFDIDNNNFHSADTFSLKLSAQALDAAAKQQLGSQNAQCTLQMDTAWFASQQDMYVELFIGEPKDSNDYGESDLKSWIYGQADDIDYVLEEGIISISGRDLTRLFIDSKITMKWQNLKSYQIVQKIAALHGLTAVIPTPTTAKAGDLFKTDFVQMNDNRSEWDLLCALAQVEDYVVFVRGTSLYFQPKPDPTKSEPYNLVYVPASDKEPSRGNFERMKLSRALTISRGIQVQVSSWNKAHAQGFTVVYPSSPKSINVGKSSTGAGSQLYTKIIPNKSQDEINKIAQSWYAQLVAHEMRMEVESPGDNSLDITSIISLSGTSTAFDQSYFPDSIHRTFNFNNGYSMSFTAKNHSSDSQVSQ